MSKSVTLDVTKVPDVRVKAFAASGSEHADDAEITFVFSDEHWQTMGILRMKRPVFEELVAGGIGIFAAHVRLIENREGKKKGGGA